MKLFVKIAISIILIVSCIFIPQKMYSKLNSDEITEEYYRKREAYFHGTLEMWQIDCFEGGTGSRANWLKNITSAFEKKHNGVYVNVNSITLDIANKLISSGQKMPDIISYGNGITFSSDLFENLQINTDNLHISAKKISTEWAVPWCMGAYFMFGDDDISKWGNDGKTIEGKKASKTVYSVGIGVQNGYSGENALFSCCENDFTNELSLKYDSPSEIFSLYNYSEKVNRFVGTQRDIYRLKTATERNSCRDTKITLLSKYNDLFQFVSVLKSDDDKKVSMANAFAEYLIQTDTQSQIGLIGLFPVNLTALPEYTAENMQNAWNDIKSLQFGNL